MDVQVLKSTFRNMGISLRGLAVLIAPAQFDVAQVRSAFRQMRRICVGPHILKMNSSNSGQIIKSDCSNCFRPIYFRSVTTLTLSIKAETENNPCPLSHESKS
jgi:hypothetical protein